MLGPRLEHDARLMYHELPITPLSLRLYRDHRKAGLTLLPGTSHVAMVASCLLEAHPAPVTAEVLDFFVPMIIPPVNMGSWQGLHDQIHSNCTKLEGSPEDDVSIETLPKVNQRVQ